MEQTYARMQNLATHQAIWTDWIGLMMTRYGMSKEEEADGGDGGCILDDALGNYSGREGESLHLCIRWVR